MLLCSSFRKPVFLSRKMSPASLDGGYSSKVRYGLIKVYIHTTSIVKFCSTCSTLDHSNAVFVQSLLYSWLLSFLQDHQLTIDSNLTVI